jgi:hypothetical protein
MNMGQDLIEGVPITFGVSFTGHAYIIEVPKERETWFDGSHMNDQFEEFPDNIEPGVYRGTFSFEFQQGFFEGYPADGESSVYLTLEKYSRVTLT